MSSPPALDPVQSGTAMLALPKTSTLTAGQLDGEECPWCGTELTIRARVDLGERPGPQGVTIHPWACGPCVTTQARETYNRHPSYCTRCAKDPYSCGVRRVWRRLALETRR
ncbi:hypothetical protein ACIQ6R_13410 [Streptomyces sp. NPDC096048]|uniref:hypothetical protein n=1 Tax=Streptomyces sp. NPDC096048 TaxID=3366072 RepID=UPI003818A747